MALHEIKSNPIGPWFTGFATGCGLMYLLDPSRGNRRRALFRDKLIRANRVARTAADKTLRDLQHRAVGIVAELRSAVQSDHCSDDVLIQRVRARLGRACSHPGAIEVSAFDGDVALHGAILESETELVLNEVRDVRGVRSLEHRLEPHKTPENIPDLQGGFGHRQGQRPDLLQSRWAPGTRFVVGTAGALLLIRGIRRGGILGIPETILGGGMLTRAAINFDLSRMLGAGETRSAVRTQKTITMHAPIEQVFNLWAHPENFSRFMSRVKEVRRTADGRYQWTVAGPAGVSVSWESEVTQSIPNQILAWKTLPGSAIRNAGVVRFEPDASGGTRLHILMSYNPPGGALGHLLAAVFGSDPKSVMDEALARMKSLLEIGKTRAHGERVTRGEISA